MRSWWTLCKACRGPPPPRARCSVSRTGWASWGRCGCLSTGDRHGRQHQKPQKPGVSELGRRQGPCALTLLHGGAATCVGSHGKPRANGTPDSQALQGRPQDTQTRPFIAYSPESLDSREQGEIWPPRQLQQQERSVRREHAADLQSKTGTEAKVSGLGFCIWNKTINGSQVGFLLVSVQIFNVQAGAL